jgi:hypothetical protein
MPVESSGDSGRGRLAPLAAKPPLEVRETKRVIPLKGCVLKKPLKQARTAVSGGLWAELSPWGEKMLGNGGNDGEY